jgi:prepilin-type N-terminal cleavage/methylation domain-containing protein
MRTCPEQSRREGFTLVEMLVVIVVMPVAAVVLNRLFITFIRDIPKSTAVVQENTILLNMLSQIRNDIDKATGLPTSFEGLTTSDELLLLEQPDGIICYQLKEGRVLRYKLPDTQDADDKETQTWSVPNAVIKWNIWQKDSYGYAVEISTYINQKLRKKMQKKMANSYLYFVPVPSRVEGNAF